MAVPAGIATLQELGHTVVAVDMPIAIKTRNEILFAGLGGRGAQPLPQYYAPYQERAKLTAVIDAKNSGQLALVAVLP
jgi:hypothetical protein